MTLRRRLPLYGLVLAYGVSQLGTVMSGLAIPWLVLVTTGSAARAGPLLERAAKRHIERWCAAAIRYGWRPVDTPCTWVTTAAGS